MIELRKVSFSYGEKPVLSDFSLTVSPDRPICLQGPSGCGKTTVLRLILGLEQPASGLVSAPKRMAAVFQEDRLFPTLSVGRNIAIVSGKDDHTAELLQKAGLYDWRHKSVGSLSGGMRRRLAILRALNAEADGYVLDEPFNGLDSDNRALMADLITAYTKGKPLVLVSHREGDAERLGAEIVRI